MTKQGNLRAIAPLKMPDVVPAEIIIGRPDVRLVTPTELFVDDDYQRSLAERSVRLIRKIVAEWDWRSFKPPIVVDVEGGLHVIDGQHTAIAAASHPGISQIPVLVVPSGDRKERALAFVRHNRDRLQVTPTQLHFSLAAAGDEDALTINQICQRAGARVLKNPPAFAKFKVGDTMAVQQLRSLLNRRHAKGAREVVEVCVKGCMAPVSANGLKAVEELIFGTSYAGSMLPDDIATTIRSLDVNLEKEASRFAAEHDLPLWKSMVVVIFKKTKKVRNGRVAA